MGALSASTNVARVVQPEEMDGLSFVVGAKALAKRCQVALNGLLAHPEAQRNGFRATAADVATEDLVLPSSWPQLGPKLCIASLVTGPAH